MMIFSLLLPLAAIGAPPVCIGAYIIVIVFNLASYNKRFGDLNADKKRGEKLVIPFHPYPYCIPEVGRYYIKTNLNFYPYISIDKETYMWMSSDQVLYIEIAPKSEIIFNITAEEPPESGPTHPMLKTPSQVKDRSRWN